ncbi:MAG TPA: Hsp20/alpha crystallin family protein [Candidatus Krumholzibacteria bacterium]|nr:Hsp20/alpha crystallin family protein [Candidatus Krumholzibacteria bacterium]
MTALTRYRPRTGLDILRQDPFFTRLFGEWAPDELDQDTQQWMPSLDLVEHEDTYEIRVDVPGIDPKDIEVMLQNDVLIIRGERHGSSEKETEEGKVLRRESWNGRFERSIRLPGGVNAAKVKAKGRDGVLQVTLPKAEESIGRRISIES